MRLPLKDEKDIQWFAKVMENAKLGHLFLYLLCANKQSVHFKLNFLLAVLQLDLFLNKCKNNMSMCPCVLCIHCWAPLSAAFIPSDSASITLEVRTTIGAYRTQLLLQLQPWINHLWPLIPFICGWCKADQPRSLLPCAEWWMDWSLTIFLCLSPSFWPCPLVELSHLFAIYWK